MIQDIYDRIAYSIEIISLDVLAQIFLFFLNP